MGKPRTITASPDHFITDGVTTEAEFLRAVIFIATSRLKVIGEDAP